MSEHTPGPWHAAENYVYRSLPALPEMIARCPDMEHMPYLANARLIAAAPALLELCKTAQKHIGCILENPGISGMLSYMHWAELASTKLELDRIIASVESEAS